MARQTPQPQSQPQPTSPDSAPQPQPPTPTTAPESPAQTPPSDPLLLTIHSLLPTYSNEALSGFVGPLLIDFGFSDPTRYLKAASIGAAIRSFILSNPLASSLVRYYRDTLSIHDPYYHLALLTRHAFTHNLQSFILASHPSPLPAPATPINPELTEPISG